MSISRYSLKELRARKGETQAQTANSLGISTQTYCAWEKDISRVSVGKLIAVARHFGVGIDEISFAQFESSVNSYGY